MLTINNKRVFVAGGAGFVGSAIVHELIDLGSIVTSFDNYFHGTPTNFAGLENELNIIEGDACDEKSLLNAMKSSKCDYVINCIGDTYVPSAYSEPQRFFDINLKCNLNILKAAERCNVTRMLYVSSTEVYGIVDVDRISEIEPLNPVNTYAVSKTAADRLCYTYYLEHNFPVIIARIFNCYGPRETHPYIIPEIIHQFSRGDTVRLGNVKAQRDFTYVHDTARALISVLMSSIRNGDVVNVGSDKVFSIEWLAKTIAHEMGIKNPSIITNEINRMRRLDIDYFRCDNSKLKELTGWNPEVEMLDGLQRTIHWYKENGKQWSWENRGNDVEPL